MRRIDIINSSSKLEKFFSEIQLRHLLLNARQKNVDPEGLYAAFKKYAIAESNFNDIDKKILEIFGLENLSDHRTWLAFVDHEDLELISVTMSSIHLLTKFLPRVVELLKQDHVSYDSKDERAIIETSPDNSQEFLTLILPENSKEISSVERVLNLFQSLSALHEFVMSINKMDHSNLNVAAIDSGSDKSFDLVGVAKAIAGLKEILFGVWDRVVFHREKKAEVRIGLVLKTLPAMAMIHEYKAEGKITDTEAMQMQNLLETGVEKFLKSGAILNEFQDMATNEPRKILAAEPKLIGMQESSSGSTINTGEITNKSPNSIDDIAGFSPEQLEVIRQLIEQKEISKQQSEQPISNRPKKTKGRQSD